MDLTDDQIERYSRHLLLRELGGPGQMKLLQSSVLVIGAGGLGAPLLQYLAAAGVGRIGIVDDDTVALSNLQRQVIHDTSRVGDLKVESARNALSRINPDVIVDCYPNRVTQENAIDLISEYDLVADGCDNFETRFLINRICYQLGIPLVSAAVGRFDGQIATFRAAAGNDLPCYQCLVPAIPPAGAVPTCAEAGVLGALTGVIGSLQALEVIKELTGMGQGLTGKLMLYDGLSARTRLVTLNRDPNCPICRH